jgi:hypothetical protein
MFESVADGGSGRNSAYTALPLNIEKVRMKIAKMSGKWLNSLGKSRNALVREAVFVTPDKLLKSASIIRDRTLMANVIQYRQ